jgi:hypothetical protein
MKLSPILESYRVVLGFYASKPGQPFGAFDGVPGPCGDKLTILVADGVDTGWEHVSVSKRRHIPNWVEMCFVKDLCWDEEACVIQYHPPKSRHVNNHPNCLHLWRPIKHEIAQPPDILVGLKELGELT